MIWIREKGYFLFSRKAFWRTQIHHTAQGDFVWARAEKFPPTPTSHSQKLSFASFFPVCEKWISSETTWHIFRSNTNLHFLHSNGTLRRGRLAIFYSCINFSQTHIGFFFLRCHVWVQFWISIQLFSCRSLRDVWTRIIARNSFFIYIFYFDSEKIHSMIMQNHSTVFQYSNPTPTPTPQTTKYSSNKKQISHFHISPQMPSNHTILLFSTISFRVKRREPERAEKIPPEKYPF